MSAVMFARSRLPWSVRTVCCLSVVFSAAAYAAPANPIAAAQPAPAALPAQISCDSGSILVFADIPRFWEAWDAAAGLDQTGRVEAFQRLYLDRGSPGLKSFLSARIGSAKDLVAEIDQRPRYYAQLRAQQQTLADLAPKLCAALQGLKRLLPDATIPPAYFLIGRMNSGGTVDTSGLLIGTEMYGRRADTPADELNDWHRTVLGAPEQLPHIVAHELVHTQQGPESFSDQSLLAASIREGTADFLAELSSGRHINQAAHTWAEPRAETLWEEFQSVMDQNDYAGWLYDSSQVPKRPADLGYWMGYRIACAYYRKADDQTEALKTLLRLSNAHTVLEQSQVDTDFRSGDTRCRSPLVSVGSQRSEQASPPP